MILLMGCYSIKHKAIHNKLHATIPISPKRRIMWFREFVQSRTNPFPSAPRSLPLGRSNLWGQTTVFGRVFKNNQRDR